MKNGLWRWLTAKNFKIDSKPYLTKHSLKNLLPNATVPQSTSFIRNQQPKRKNNQWNVFEIIFIKNLCFHNDINHRRNQKKFIKKIIYYSRAKYKRQRKTEFSLGLKCYTIDIFFIAKKKNVSHSFFKKERIYEFNGNC